MAGVVINSGKTGRLERQFDSEPEMLQAVIDWCVQRDEHVVGYVQIGAEDLFSFKAHSVYRVEAGPSGDSDGEGYIRIRWLASG